MIPTYIDNDVEVAKAVNCKMLSGYSMLPNYRNYWKEVGYQQEMEGAEQAIAVWRFDKPPQLLTDQWLADTTLFVSASAVRAYVEAWLDVGVKTSILLPSSANGGQMRAFEELLASYSQLQLAILASPRAA